MRHLLVAIAITILALLLAGWAAIDTHAAAPEPQGFDNICTCYSVVCFFRAEYQPNGEPSDHEPEPVLLWMQVPRWAVHEFVSGNWGCSRGMGG